MSEVPPPPPDLENKFQRNIGLLIGLGLGLLLLGFFGLMISNQNYNDIARYVNYEGTRNGNWLFRDLTRQIAIFSTFTITGAIAIFWGWLKLRSKSARQQLLHADPLRNGLIGGGGALAFFSLQFLFMYLLTGDSFQLWLFLTSCIVGVVLVACSFTIKN
jgi:hypothetical protein